MMLIPNYLSKEIPGLISFRMDWLDLLTVQGTLKSLLQHHSWKASILQGSAFFRVQPSHPYMTTGKTIALIRQTFVGKVMSLLFNMLSRLVITFLPMSKRLLISWLQSPSAVNGIKTCIISYKKWIASPGSMQNTGSLGLVHWDDPEGWYGEGSRRGVQDGNTCATMADACWCMAKPIHYCKVKKKKTWWRRGIVVCEISLWRGNWESTSSAFWFQMVWDISPCGQFTINIFHLAEVSYL